MVFPIYARIDRQALLEAFPWGVNCRFRIATTLISSLRKQIKPEFAP